MANEPTPTWFFVLVVVRKADQFLLVHERKHGQLWYLPAGRVEPGEELVKAAVRETFEESGIFIEMEGILRVEHTPFTDGKNRIRFIFLARPRDDTPPRVIPNEESLGAAWVRYHELNNYQLRGSEVREIFEYVESGGAVYPLEMLSFEGGPYNIPESHPGLPVDLPLFTGRDPFAKTVPVVGSFGNFNVEDQVNALSAVLENIKKSRRYFNDFGITKYEIGKSFRRDHLHFSVTVLVSLQDNSSREEPFEFEVEKLQNGQFQVFYLR